MNDESQTAQETQTAEELRLCFADCGDVGGN